MKKATIISLVLIPLAVVLTSNETSAQGYCAAYTSSYVWFSGNYAWGQGTTEGSYCSGSHDVWEAIRLTSPTGRQASNSVYATTNYSTVLVSLAMLGETGTYTTSTDHWEWCPYLSLTIYLGATSAGSAPQCVTPTGESIYANQPAWLDPNEPAVGLWAQTLLPVTSSFAGRTVKEFNVAGGQDSCWYLGNPAGLPAATTHDESSWNVNSGNVWGPDGIGWTVQSFNTVSYYRGLNRAPCSFNVPQKMAILCTANSTWHEYLQHNIQGTIGTVTVSSRRGSQVMTRSY
jgi:hypothetical protein